MNRFDRRVRLLATGLAALAGFVDATGFLRLGGFFTSFMSGNSTRLAVGVAAGSHTATIAGGLIGTFVAGVMAGSLTGQLARQRRRPAVLLLVAGLLAAAAALSRTNTTAAVAAMVLAMGAENAVFERDGEVEIGLTYMTGTLVKFGQRLTGALLGGARFAWVSYLSLWLGLVTGAVTGALIYPVFGLDNLWFAAVAALVFAAIAVWL